jgi:hypothetical protein
MSIFLPDQTLRYQLPPTTAATVADVSHIVLRLVTLHKDKGEGPQVLWTYIPSPSENEPASHGVPYRTALRLTTQSLSPFAESHQPNCVLTSATFILYPPPFTDAPNSAIPLSRREAPLEVNGTILSLTLKSSLRRSYPSGLSMRAWPIPIAAVTRG